MAIIIVVQKFHHYILLCTTIVLADQNPMYYFLTRQVIGGKYSHWIIILQEFDLKFAKDTSKKSLFITELNGGLPYALMEAKTNDSFSDEFLFLTGTTDLWYGYLIIYLQTQRFHPNLSHDDRQCICRHAKYYLILNDTLYQCGIDSMLQ